MSPARVIQVDLDSCQGHGKCYLLAPGLLAPGADGEKPRFQHPAISGDDANQIKEGDLAIGNCPEYALSWSVPGPAIAAD